MPLWFITQQVVCLCMLKEIVLTDRELQVMKILRTWLMNRGTMPSIRELMTELDYKSPRSVAELIDSLVKKKFLKKKDDGSLILIKDIQERDRAFTVEVPILGSVACGLPLFSEQNIEGYIPVTAEIIKRPHKYFILKAKGDSMDLSGINDGDFVLIKQQQAANDGDIVVALIDDEATIKKFQRSPSIVVLKPCSTNPSHSPIILSYNFLIQGVVVLVIPHTHV